MSQSPLGVADWIGLVLFLIASAGMLYAIITIPAEVEKAEHKTKEPAPDKKISYSKSGITIKTNKRMGAEDAAYSMVKGGRNLAKTVKATGAASVKKVPNPIGAVPNPLGGFGKSK